MSKHGVKQQRFTLDKKQNLSSYPLCGAAASGGFSVGETTFCVGCGAVFMTGISTIGLAFGGATSCTNGDAFSACA